MWAVEIWVGGYLSLHYLVINFGKSYWLQPYQVFSLFKPRRTLHSLVNMPICSQISQFRNTSCRSATYVLSFVCHKLQFQPTSNAGVRFVSSRRKQNENDYRMRVSVMCIIVTPQTRAFFEKLTVTKLVRNNHVNTATSPWFTLQESSQLHRFSPCVGHYHLLIYAYV